MGGFMPPFPFPPFGMPPFMPCGRGCTGECQNGGGGGGFPEPMLGGMNFPGRPPPSMVWPGSGSTNFPDSGGQNFPGPQWPGTGPSNGGSGVTTSEVPYIYPLGATGQRIIMIIDTGASMTIVTPVCYNRHFRSIPIRTDKRLVIHGYEGVGQGTNQRFTMPLIFNFDNRQIKLEGEAWICDNGIDVECLLGLPFLRANHMSLEWGSDGEPDSIMVQGQKIPIETQVDEVRYKIGKPTSYQRKGRLLRVGGKRK
jgi:hypothetical protein